MTALKFELQPDDASGDFNNGISKTLNKTPPDGLQELDHAMLAVRTITAACPEPEPIAAPRASRLVPRASPLAPRPSPLARLDRPSGHSPLIPCPSLPHLDRPLPLAPLPYPTP